MITEERYLCMGCMSRLDENGKCRCGYDENAPTDSACLPVRTVVGNRYLVGRMISMNGEGITYICFDTENEERAFIEEYMPQNMAKRNELTGEVTPLSGYEAQYKCLMTDFYDLFDALRNFRHNDYIIPVTDVIYDKNTAYAVHKYVKTISYGDYLTHNGGEFTWPQVKKLFMPLFTTLTYLHSNGFVHRGLSPESIRVNAKGQLMLSGFGTASLYTKGSAIEPELSEGYSAPEQYSSSSWQGEWTDVYSIAAVLYKSLTGTLPVSAAERRENDTLCPPEELEQNVPSNVSDAIMNAMQLSVEYRTQSIDDFTAELLESSKSNTMMYDPQKAGETGGEDIFKKTETILEKPVRKRYEDEEPKRGRKIPWGLIMFIIAMVVLLGVLAFVFRFPEVIGIVRNNNSGSSVSESSNEESSNDEGTVNFGAPGLVGRYRKDVEGNEKYQQFNLVFVEENNSSYPEGMIFEQSIKKDTPVAEGTEIVLKVSVGPEKVPMPRCVGMTIEEARAALDALGIVYQEVPNFSTQYEYNIVYEQSAAEGEEVATGNTLTKVYIYYGANQDAPTTSDSDNPFHVSGNTYTDDDDDGVIKIG
mgnify:CR=1 FL=1